MAGKIRLIGAVGIKVRPDTSEFKKELREQVKNLPDYDIEVNVDADTTIAKRKLEKLKAEAEKNSLKLTLDENVFDDIQNAQKQIKRAIANLSKETITIGLNDKELQAKLKNLQTKARGAKVNMEYNDDQAGYEAILSKIRSIRRQKMVKEVEFKTDNKSLAETQSKFEKLLADLPTPVKTLTIKHRNDHESLTSAIAQIDQALADLKQVEISPKLTWTQLMAEKKKLQKELADKPLVMKMTDDKESYEAVLKKITDLQKQAAATEFQFQTDAASLDEAAKVMRDKIAALTPKPNITFTYENDSRGMHGALAEVEKKLAELGRIKLTADLDEAGLLKAKEELEEQLATSTFKIDVDSTDLDALKTQAKALEDMMKVYNIPDVSITVQNTPEDMERAKKELEELVKQREAEIKAKPVTWDAMLELAYASRARDVPFYVRINQRSLAIAEGVLQSLAGINVLQSTGRQLETLVTNFDRISLKTGAVSALIGSLANTFIYLGTAMFPVGEGILNVVGLLAMAPAALAAVTATAVINVAAWQDFGDAVDGSAEALAKLPPEAQRTALALRGTWTKMQEPIQNRFWEGMGDSMRDSMNKLIPIFSEGLAGTAEHIGRFTAGIFRSMEKVADSGVLSVMLGNLEAMFDNAAGAAEPLFDALNRIGLRGSEYLPQFGTWLTEITTRFDNWIKKSDEAGEINRWIEEGVQSLKDMWLMGTGITKMFQAINTAAKTAGAGGLGDVAKRFDEIGTMMKGEPFQSRLSTIFNGARKGASELNVGVQELGVTLGESSLFVANLLQELGKLGGGALSSLSAVLGNMEFQSGILHSVQSLNGLVVTLRGGFDDLGSVIGGLANIASAAFSSIGPVINQVIGLLNSVVGTLDQSIMETIPTLMGLVGGLITTLSGPIEVAAGAVRLLLDGINSLPGPIQSALTALVTFLLLAGKIGPMFQMKPGGLMERIKYDIEQADTARGKFQAGFKGMGAAALAAVGGPWGIAIGALVTGLAMFGQAQADAAAKVQTLTDAIVAQDDANLESQIYKMWSEIDSGPMENFWRDAGSLWTNGKKAANEAANSIGIDSKRITEAIKSGQGETMAKDLDTLSKAAARFPPSADEISAAAGRLGINMTNAEIKNHAGDFGVLGANVLDTSKHFGTATFKADEFGKQVDNVPLDPAKVKLENFNAAMSVYNDTAASADSRTRALKSALDILSGKELSMEEAQLKVNDALRQGAGLWKDNEGNVIDYGNIINSQTGVINTASTAGADLWRNLSGVGEGVLETATKMKDAKQPIGDITKFLTDSRQAYIDNAVAAGQNGELVAAAYDHMIGANPEELATLISAVGTEDAKGQVRSFQTVLDELTARKAVATIAGDNTELGVALGKSYTDLGLWDQTIATATANLNPEQAHAERQRLTDELIVLANSNPTVKAHLDPKILEQRKAEVEQQLRDLAGQRPTPQVDAETAAAKAKLDSINGALNGITDRKATVTIDYNAVGSALEQGLPIPRSANGSILNGKAQGMFGFMPQYFANGGFYGGRPVKQFANGGVENHVAQIARGATPYRIWAEPETGGEAYIPLSQAKRGRSTQILEQVAKQFGYNLTKAQAFADGGVVNGGNQRATSGLQVHIDTFNQNANDTIDDVGRGLMRHVRIAGMAGITEGI